VPTTHLLYLHGFRSSPQSTKARQVAAWIAQHRPHVVWCCPQLAVSPREALNHVLGAIANWPIATLAVMGSSLGGFYATVVAERLGCKAVLLNPAVYPARDLVGYVGDMKSWHSDEVLSFRAEYIDELQAMHPAAITRPERYYAVIAKGDEVLDWREMSARYTGCRIELLEGGDHALSNFAPHLPRIAEFLDLAR
jgi:uncharacterized protein